MDTLATWTGSIKVKKMPIPKRQQVVNLPNMMSDFIVFIGVEDFDCVRERGIEHLWWLMSTDINIWMWMSLYVQNNALYMYVWYVYFLLHIKMSTSQTWAQCTYNTFMDFSLTSSPHLMYFYLHLNRWNHSYPKPPPPSYPHTLLSKINTNFHFSIHLYFYFRGSHLESVPKKRMSQRTWPKRFLSLCARPNRYKTSSNGC